MKVYVINRHGRPLMPTIPRKARLLLKSGKAKIVGRDPFTIQLVYGSSGYTQPVELGIDAGYENIGFSTVNEKEEVIGGELKMLKGISERITEKRKYRRTRRNRLRYRKPSFSNRRINKGWLAPSIQHKLDTHHHLIDKNCKNKADSPILQVHHLGFFQKPPDRTDRPANLVTLCTKCHTSKNHQKKGFLFGWNPKLKSFKGETFMTIVRWRLTEEGQHNHKVSAGRRSIKKKRYPYKQHDLVLFEGTIYKVIGMQNLGAGVKLKNYPGVKNKVVKPSAVKPIRKRGGMCEAVQ